MDKVHCINHWCHYGHQRAKCHAHQKASCLPVVKYHNKSGKILTLWSFSLIYVEKSSMSTLIPQWLFVFGIIEGQDGVSVVWHYNDVKMWSMASQITIVYSTVYSGADQRKHQSTASLAFVREIHRRPVNSPHKGPVTRKMFPFDYVIMEAHFLSNYLR